MGQLDNAVLQAPGTVHYRNISLLFQDIQKTQESGAWMMGALGILVGLEIVAKEWYFNVPYKTERCGDLTCYKDFATLKSGQIFKDGIKALTPLDNQTIGMLWNLRNRLAHAFTLPPASILKPHFAPGTHGALMDDAVVSCASVVVVDKKTVYYISNIRRALTVAHGNLMKLSVTPGWQEVHELLLVD